MAKTCNPLTSKVHKMRILVITGCFFLATLSGVHAKGCCGGKTTTTTTQKVVSCCGGMAKKESTVLAVNDDLTKSNNIAVDAGNTASAAAAGGGGEPPKKSGCCKGKSNMPAEVNVANSGHVETVGNKSSCCGVMPMTFQNTTHTLILFSWWETVKEWEYALSCLIWVLLGILSVYLKVVRMRVPQFTQGIMRNYDNNSMEDAPWWRKFPVFENFILMLVCTFLYAYDYLLMLVVMTFNVGLFFSVCGGLGLGVFFFGHLLTNKPKRSAADTDTPQVQCNCKNMTAENVTTFDDTLRIDPACCGA